MRWVAQTHEKREYVAAFVLAASSFLIVLFGVSLALAAGPLGAGGRPFWQIVLMGGSVLAGAVWILAAFTHFALADAANSSRVSGDALQALNVLEADSWVAFNSGLGVMMLGAAGTLLSKSGAFRIMGWMALVAGVALFVPFADFIALIVTGLWLIAASVLLFRRASRSTQLSLA